MLYTQDYWQCQKTWVLEHKMSSRINSCMSDLITWRVKYYQFSASSSKWALYPYSSARNFLLLWSPMKLRCKRIKRLHANADALQFHHLSVKKADLNESRTLLADPLCWCMSNSMILRKNSNRVPIKLDKPNAHSATLYKNAQYFLFEK